MAGRILCVDSISLATMRDRGKVVSSGSHGGVPAGETALAFGPRLVLFNDAGFGIEHAGVAGLAILDRAGIAATTVSTMSARIGDGRSTLLDGFLSEVNEAAYRLGARAGRLGACVRPCRGRKERLSNASGDQPGMAVVNVKSEIAGNVWKIQTKPGDRIEAEGEIMILELMKMEIPVLSPKAGIIKEIKVSEGEAIGEGQLVAILDA